MTRNASRMSAPASMSSTTSSIEVREHCATTSGGVASMYAWAQAKYARHNSNSQQRQQSDGRKLLLAGQSLSASEADA